jgi:ABC-type transport system involved in multi-copper enzyme maturation permease subunit
MSTGMNATENLADASGTVLQAQGNTVKETWWLVKWYIFTVRRRLMSKILLALLVTFFLISASFTLLTYVLITGAENANGFQCPPTPVSTSQIGNPPPNGSPTCQQAQQQQVASVKSAAAAAGQSLTFPYSLTLGGGYLGSMGIILFCIMAAALTGGEYSSGTLRLALSRGTRRGQIIAAEVTALAILSLGVAALVLVLAAVVGAAIGPLIGESIPAFSPAAVLELLIYWLACSLVIFTFSLIAFLMSTLSRNVIAGIAVALGYLIFESIVGSVLYYAGYSLHNGLGNFLQHIPDYLVGYNTGALTHLAAQGPIVLYSTVSGVTTTSSGGTSSGTLSSPGSGIDTLHGLILVGVYCVLFAGLSYVCLRRRDVTD